MSTPPRDPLPAGPLGGFVVFRREGEAWWAALLVLDTLGVPHEFLYTGPVQATPAQEVLYGATLPDQLRLQALALPMTKALRAVPCCVLSRGDLPPGLPLPVGVVHATGVRWERPASPAAAEFVAASQAGLGLDEPFERVERALEYAITHETRVGAADSVPRPPAL